MHTEEQARELWCPMVQPDDSDDFAPILCVASRCMAWRWGVQEGDPRKVGYCGLAGKP